MSIHAWLRWDAVQRLIPPEARSVLEIGAGLGGFASILNDRLDYVGLEPDAESQRIANERASGRVKRETAEEHDGTYDLVCAFEVLEHLHDDVQALSVWAELSKQWVMVSVPMNPERWGPTDVHAGHFRRYTRDGLAAALREADILPRRIVAYGFPAGYALEAARNAIVARRSSAAAMSERTAASGRWLQPPGVLRAVTWASALPFRLAQRPFAAGSRGTGLVALGERCNR